MRGVSVVIPSWNRKALLARVLDHLKKQTHPIEEVIVADNGSTDGAAEAAEAAGARVLRLGRNTGFAYAVNRGIEAARSDLIALVNNDVEPRPDWLAGLAAALDDGPDCWFATGKVLRADNPTRLDGAWDLISRGACAWRAGHGQPDSPAFSQPRVTALAPATAVLYRKELFAKVGLFEEAFESYLEDVDFGLRCARLGLRGIYVPGAIALHHGSATLGRWHRRTVRLLARNQVLLAARHLDLRVNLWHVLAGQLLWGAVAARHGCLGSWLHGKIDGLRLARAIPPLADARGSVPSRDREGAALVQSLLREHEAELRRLAPGPYWKIYFLLTPGERN